jgi:hypothetical protein
MVQEAGVRMTVEAPYFKGSMAQISSAITARGGLIHSLNSFVTEDPGHWGCILKVADISQADLVEAVKPHVVQILDVREIDDPSSKGC